MRVSIFLSALFSLIAVTAQTTPVTSGQTGPAAVPAATTQPLAMKFKRYTIADTVKFQGMVAAYGIMPVDWTVKGGLGPKLNLRLHWSDAQDTSACDIYPARSFRWYSKLGMGMRVPAGAERPPADQFEAISKVFIPIFRSDLANANMVDKQKMPELAKAIIARDGKEPQFAGCLAGYESFEYDLHGQTVREFVKLVLEEYVDRQNGITFWTISNAASRRAPKDLFDSLTPMEQFTIRSVSFNPAWNQRVSAFHQNNLQAENDARNANFAATETRIASQNEANDAEHAAYWQHSADLEQQSDQRADVMREVSPWRDSDGYTYKLPTQYGNAWAGADGTIIMNNDPGYNPNSDASLTPTNWTPMQQAGN